MAKRTLTEISNFDQSKELPHLQKHSKPIYYPPVQKSS